MESVLFSPCRLRGVVLRNRIGVAPMCLYSATDGVPDAWHLVHLGSRAVGGAGLVMTEATAVSPQGRISPHDTGLWNDAQQQAFAPIADFIHRAGAVPAIQLAHAGRKGSTQVPWVGRKAIPLADGGWETIAPTSVPFNADYPVPRHADAADVERVPALFAASAVRAHEAGFEAVEIHAGHGYLLHQFLSPLTNGRSDGWGGDFDGRCRLLMAVVDAVRAVWPERLPVLVRLSVTDWLDGGWDLEQSIALSRRLAGAGVDLVDCSSGSISPASTSVQTPGWQVPFAERIRTETGIATAAVGRITEPAQAEAILAGGQADLVFLARALLRDPYWPLHARQALEGRADWPVQYLRAVA